MRQVREELLKQQRECEEQVTAAVTSRDVITVNYIRTSERKVKLIVRLGEHVM